jgi:hypothetical protein
MVLESLNPTSEDTVWYPGIGAVEELKQDYICCHPHIQAYSGPFLPEGYDLNDYPAFRTSLLLSRDCESRAFGCPAHARDQATPYRNVFAIHFLHHVHKIANLYHNFNEHTRASVCAFRVVCLQDHRSPPSVGRYIQLW